MINKKYILPLFVLVVIVQLIVPSKMVMDQEDVLASGSSFKFKTAPVDPYDPFRGRYVILSFDENIFEVGNDTIWSYDDPVFVEVEENADGFAKIKSISKTPYDHEDYFKAKIQYINKANQPYHVRIEYPFSRLYMEEFKAKDAETAYWEASRDSVKVTYAEVYVKNGKTVLNDVFIDDVSIQELVNPD